MLGSVKYSYAQTATNKFVELFDGLRVFENPKPVSDLASLIPYVTDEDDLVLDFFAGSGTLAHATLNTNVDKDSARRFILVQLPEPTTSIDANGLISETEASKAGYKTIADLTKERVRRVIQQQEKQTDGKLDLQTDGQRQRKAGFRVFKLAPSNFKVWEAHTDEGVEEVQRQMELAVHHILPDRTAEDLFFEILMKSEYPLTAKVECFDAAGVAAYSVQDDELIICVERAVTEEAVNAIVKRKPSKVIFLDEAFSGNDQLKANAKMNFEAAGVKRFETV